MGGDGETPDVLLSGTKAAHRVAPEGVTGEGPMRSHRKLVVLTAALIAMITPFAGSAAPPSGGLNPAQLLTGLEGGSGSTVGLGGAMDVAFIGKTAYALVTLVGSDVGGSDVVGIYRVDGPDSFTVVADIGAFALSNPPVTPFDIPTGVQYALETYRGGFLVTDGHHNRMLRVTLDGEVTELIAFGNIVP